MIALVFKTIVSSFHMHHDIFLLHFLSLAAVSLFNNNTREQSNLSFEIMGILQISPYKLSI